MLAHLKIGTALSAGFTLAIGVALVISLTSWAGLNGTQRGVTELSEHALPNTRALGKFDEARTAIQRNVNGLLVPRVTGELRQGGWRALEDALTRLHESRKEWEAIPSRPETEAAWKGMVAELEPWERAVQTSVALGKERDRLLAAGLGWDSNQVQGVYDREWTSFLEVAKLARAIDVELTKVRAAAEQEERSQAEDAQAAGRRALVTLWSTFIAGLALVAALAIALTLGISRIVQSLAAEANKLSGAVRAGQLQTRADVGAVHFQFRGVVQGMNDTMDAFARPIRMASENMDRISRGDIPAQVADAYEGDFEEIKQSVNRCIGAVASVVHDVRALADAAVTGKLSVRADPGEHAGDFRKIVEGLNGTLDAVMKPIEEAMRVMQRLADRDLRARVDGSYQGDHARMTEALNATAEALHGALAQVAEAVEQVSSASAQIASSSQAVASGASEQAASLEETGSSLESISSMTKQSADNAQQASVLATTARGAATEGATAMAQMTGAMAKIKASAEGTSQIIKDINEIAFQTNLLALNAAVEAARAGEAGRGFAVVAEEVRSLALRSKEAANKTEELIRQSVKEAGEGEVTAKHVGEKLAAIVGSVAKVTEIVAEISASAAEQATGVEQIGRAMGQMNTVTQQNAASSEESSSAASELSAQSEELAAMIAQFQLQQGAGIRAPAAARAPSPALRQQAWQRVPSC